jgi:DNA-binding LytR/AlgR family response regulator
MIPHSQPDDPRTARGHGSKGDVPGEDEREDSQPRGTATPPSLYWVCQVFGWSCYCVVHVAYLLLSGLSLVGTIFYSLLVCFESFGITHCFRKIVRSHRWEDLPLRSLVFRVAGSTIVLAGLFALCTYLNSPIFASLFGYPADWSYFNRYPALLLIFFLNGLFVFGLWTSIYFGVHFVGQRRRAEQDRQRIALELSEARLAMLTEQINPHAYDYLLKPIEPVRLAACLTRLRDRRPAERIEPGTLGGPLRAEDQVFVREGESCWMIQVSEIELLDAVENYTRVHFRGRSALVVRSLAALEDRLDPRLFFRANRQQIINLRGVQKIQPWFSRGLLVVLNSCVQVQISRRRSLAFRELKSL